MPTTQPQSVWTPTELVMVASAIAGIVATVLIPALTLMIKQVIAAIAEARRANGRIDDLHGQVQSVQSQMTDLAKQMPPPPPAALPNAPAPLVLPAELSQSQINPQR